MYFGDFAVKSNNSVESRFRLLGVFVDLRQQALEKWLGSRFPRFSLETMAGDASFRRYFRVITGEKTFVAMDAPLNLKINTVVYHN